MTSMRIAMFGLMALAAACSGAASEEQQTEEVCVAMLERARECRVEIAEQVVAEERVPAGRRHVRRAELLAEAEQAYERIGAVCERMGEGIAAELERADSCYGAGDCGELAECVAEVRRQGMERARRR